MTTPERRLGEKPSKVAPADLGSVFGAPVPDRTGGLRGLNLAPPPKTEPVVPQRSTAAQDQATQADDATLPADAESEDDAVVEAKQATKAPRRPKTQKLKPTSSAPAADAADGAPQASRRATVTTSVVYLPVALRDQLRDHVLGRQKAGELSLTHTDVVLQAFEAHHTDLPSLLAAAGEARPKSSLFGDVEHRRRRRRHNEPQVQMSLRFTDSELRVIDGLVEANATSRSAAVAAVLTAALASS